MLVNFVDKVGGPDRAVCEAELVFEPTDGLLAGLKLVGFTLWRSAEGEVYVTFPSRAFGAGPDRRYFDLLRSMDGQGASIRRVKDWILQEHRASLRAA